MQIMPFDHACSNHFVLNKIFLVKCDHLLCSEVEKGWWKLCLWATILVDGGFCREFHEPGKIDINFGNGCGGTAFVSIFLLATVFFFVFFCITKLVSLEVGLDHKVSFWIKMVGLFSMNPHPI